MVNSILNAVTKQLGTTFGNKYHYYVEDIEQNLVKPCFTVDVLTVPQRSKSAVLYDRTMPIVIHHFTDDENNTKKTLYSIAEQAVECLEYLNFLNTILRADDISWEITDGVLQIFMTYRFTTTKVVGEETNIGEMDYSVSHTK